MVSHMLPHAGNVLESRVVSTLADRSRLEWRRIADGYGGSVWKPFQISKAGDVLAEPAMMPLPGSQQVFLNCPVWEALYCSPPTAGTDSLLLDFLQEIGKGYRNAWRGVMIHTGDVDDFNARVGKLTDSIYRVWERDSQVIVLRSNTDAVAKWVTGEELSFRIMQSYSHYSQIHGHEYPWVGFHALDRWREDKLYRLSMSCLRSSRSGVPLRIRATTTADQLPAWITKRFGLPESFGKIIRTPGERDRVAISGNPTEDFAS